ncbi:MAG: TetR/AcrR family transcriptional regulator [Alphaproteobacteria bacterium]
MPYDILDLTPRQPKQARGRAKVERILDAATQLVKKHGADALSSPAVAELAGIPVASVYQFFPTRYAILNELSRRHMAALEERITKVVADGVDHWMDGFDASIDVVAAYLNKEPVARELFLRGPIIPEVLNVSLESDDRIADFVMAVLPENDQKRIEAMKPGLSPARVAINLVIATFATGMRMEGSVTENARAEARRVVRAYLSSYFDLD